jgi:alkyl sulfatase BDS1-like metallo-beta-lactamase superfamily hydrolase
MPALRCPVCKAENSAGPLCRRCKADLAVLWELETHRERLLAAARQAAGRGEWRTFLTLVEQAVTLREDEETTRLLLAGLVLNGDYHGACGLARGLS